MKPETEIAPLLPSAAMRRGHPLYDLATIVNLISHTSTSQGLTVRCEVDKTKYEKGIEVTDAELATVNLKRHDWHSEWNYTVKKRTIIPHKVIELMFWQGPSASTPSIV